MDETARREIQELLASGNKLAAVKRYREASGASLAESKAAVESLQAANALPEQRPLTDSDLTSQVVSLLGKGERIQAIKLYRSQAGVRLKQAKQAVDRIGEQHGIPAAKGVGCLGAILALVVVLEILNASFV